MKNALLIVHIVIAITATTLFLFQIAMLMKSMSSYLEGEDLIIGAWKTYTRITSKSEAAARARYAET
jgi:hypothetical protein